jgi:hypothetical protein
MLVKTLALLAMVLISLLPISIIASLIIWFKNKNVNSIWLKRLYWYRVIIFTPLILAIAAKHFLTATNFDAETFGRVFGTLIWLWVVTKRWAK